MNIVLSYHTFSTYDHEPAVAYETIMCDDSVNANLSSILIDDKQQRLCLTRWHKSSVLAIYPQPSLGMLSMTFMLI